MDILRTKNIYSFCIFVKAIENPLWDCITSFGDYYFMYDCNTSISIASTSDMELLVFGDAVNVITGEYDNIAESLLEGSSSLIDIINKEKFLGGQYIILIRDHNSYYFLGDATTSIPIFYASLDNNTIVSSYEALIAKFGGLEPDKELVKIREAGNESQPMPSDVTIFREIRALLPNHYLNLTNLTTARFVNSEIKKPMIAPKEAALIIDPMIHKLTEYYCDKYNIDCPITGGKDSRVVLAYFLDINPQIRCYTIQHKSMNDQDDDLIIPKAIAERLKLNYSVLKDEEAGSDVATFFEEMFGQVSFSCITLNSVVTVNHFCKGNAISDGDIIGQVGKGSLHRDIPESLANPRYFRCKIHNYSNESLQYIKEWMNNIKQSEEKECIFDLFSIENRLGRWAGQSRQIHNLFGQRIVNVFNSRSIIYVMTKVSRKDRKNSKIHIELLKLHAPNIVDLRFANKDGLLERVSKVNGLTFYVGSVFKYYINGRSHI